MPQSARDRIRPDQAHAAPCRWLSRPGMKSFLRDLAFLGLFAAAVAAVVLVVLVHQGRFSLPPEPAAEEVASSPPRAAAAMAPGSTTEDASASSARTDAPVPLPYAIALDDASAAVAPTSSFDPSTRGVLGDARVLCLPELTWLQEQLGRWAAEVRGPRRRAPATLDAAHAAARRASAFDYLVSPECWNDPTALEARGWGDCADKSLWLARELLRAGYPMVGIRLGVPEGYEPGEPGHAWVVLYHHGGEWIYDPAASPRLMSQDAAPTRRFRITATVFPR